MRIEKGIDTAVHIRGTAKYRCVGKQTMLRIVMATRRVLGARPDAL